MEAASIEEILLRLTTLEAECEEVRAIIKGPPPDEDGGLHKRIVQIERAIEQVNFIKWGVVALILMKSPDIFAMIKPILAKF